jgi:TPR repeat protein
MEGPTVTRPILTACLLAFSVGGCASNGGSAATAKGSIQDPWGSTKSAFSTSWNWMSGLFRNEPVRTASLTEPAPSRPAAERSAPPRAPGKENQTDLERALSQQAARAAAQDQQRAVESEVVKSWLSSANGGNPLAQVVVASLYENGTGVDRDLEAAARWYRKAAEQGYHRGEHHLGRMYHFGLGVPEDQALAARWLRRAADRGDAQAQGLLALLYLEGRGVPQNYQQAYLWASVAATGDAESARRADEALFASQPEKIRGELAAETARQNAEVQQWAKDIREAAARQLPAEKLAEAQQLAAGQWEQLNGAP